MKLQVHRFLRGPNPWWGSSGLLLVVDVDGADVVRLRARPSTPQLEQMLRILRSVLPATADPDAMPRPEVLAAAAAPVPELLLSLTQALVRDFCAAPETGRLLAIDQDRLTAFVPCDDEAVGLPAWNLAVAALELFEQRPADAQRGVAARLGKAYWAFRQTARSAGLNQTNIAMMRAAARRGIPGSRVTPEGQFVQLGQGCLRKRFNETATEDTSSLAKWLARDKHGTAQLLASLGVPTTGPRVAASGDEAVRIARALQAPVVVKPRASGKGQGVSVRIAGDADVAAAWRHAATYGRGVVVERFVDGDDHRLLVVGGRFVAAARRTPAEVTGDGMRSVAELVRILNTDPRRGMPFERIMEWVVIDREARQLLAESGLTPDSVPSAGRRVPLRRTANLSRGGSAEDLTDRIHPDNRALAERVARLVGLDVAGIDLLTPDLGRSWRECPCAVLEVNATPGLRPHLASNPRRDVVAPIIDHLFPGAGDARVPTAGITGSLGKTTTCRMVAAALAADDRVTALATTQGAWVGAEAIDFGDCASGIVARRLLLDPRVEVGVFELARGALIKRGMGLDACEVGAVLNVHDNHLELDGVRTREELAAVKALVVRHARRMAVLNADDPLCLAMRASVSAPRTCLVSMRADNPEVVAHLEAGGLAAFLDERGPVAQLHLREARHSIGVMSVAEIPSTWGGRFRPAIAAALFAAAVSHGLGVGVDRMRDAFAAFGSTDVDNPGRMNLHEDLPYRMLLTLADGPLAVGELADFVRTIPTAGRKLLVLTAVGNRPERFVLDSARAAAGAFDDYLCSDREDLRGRAPGEIAGLLAQGLRAQGVDPQRVTVAATHDEAIRSACGRARPGDLLVVVSISAHKARRIALELLA